MDKLNEILNDEYKNKEDILNPKEYRGIKIINRLQHIDQYNNRILTGEPSVVEEGLLLPFTYIKYIDRKTNIPIDDMYYLLIDKRTIKNIIKLMKDYDE